MKVNDVISNVNIYGFDQAVIGSKYPMATDTAKVTNEVTKTTIALGTSKCGEGHDNFLNGVIVQFDLTFTNKAWVEAERYHFLDFISSQSTMHRMTKFNLDQAYVNDVDPRIVEIMKEKVMQYNQLLESNPTDSKLKSMYLEILYSNPAGFKITAKMTTNYRQLKTIYQQRRTHRLPEWQLFCDWLETLPYSEFITLKKDEAK